MKIFHQSVHVDSNSMHEWFTLAVINQFDITTKPCCYRDGIPFCLQKNTSKGGKRGWRIEVVDPTPDQKEIISNMGYEFPAPASLNEDHPDSVAARLSAADAEELQRCKEDHLYFYNKYIRKPGDRELTEDEHHRLMDQWASERTTPPLKLRAHYKDYTLAPVDCFNRIVTSDSVPLHEGDIKTDDTKTYQPGK